MNVYSKGSGIVTDKLMTLLHAVTPIPVEIIPDVGCMVWMM